MERTSGLLVILLATVPSLFACGSDPSGDALQGDNTVAKGEVPPAGCTPTTCAAQNKNCGSISDGCGGTLDCGACGAPQTCGGGGTANVCGVPPASPPPPPPTCTSSKKNFVVTLDATFYKFDPATAAFSKVGTLNCPAKAGETPNSMAVDHAGTAWVSYTDGTLFKVDTGTASCSSTTFVPNQHNFYNFSMSFVPKGTGEMLYVVGATADFAGLGLGSIDLSTMTLTPIHDFSGSLQKQVADLAVGSDGTLYGLFATSPAVLAKIDTTTAATTVVQSLPSTVNVATATDWTFTTGGNKDFWIYTADSSVNASATSNVMHLLSDGTLTPVANSIGFVIDGSGTYTTACP